MSWLTEPDSEWDSEEQSDEPRSRLRLVALLLAGWLVVSVLVLVVLLAISGRHSGSGNSGNQAANQPTASVPAGSANPTAPASSGPVLPDGWVREASDRQTNCAAHAYGQVQSFFTRTPCVSVTRLLASTNQGGRPVVVASNVVTFSTSGQAQRYLALVNADGTGNIADLLREGARYAGGPDQLPDAAFASRLDGNRVLVAEAGYVTGISSASDPTLRTIAAEGVR